MNEKENLNYFGDEEKNFSKNFSTFRAKIFQPFCWILMKLGITANMLSCFGIFLLLGFIYFAKINSILACIFIVIHLLSDALDGPLAKERKEAGNSGAVVDIFCDHTAMVIVVLGLLFANLINSLFAVIYVYLYTLLIFLIIIRNLIKKPIKRVFRSKYELFILFGIYAIWGLNLLDLGLIIFILTMIYPLISSFIVIKNHLNESKN